MITIMFSFRLRLDYGFDFGYVMVPKNYVSFSKYYVMNILSIYKIKDLMASNGPLISRVINKRRLKCDKTK
jgi:hypothetical protein